MAKLLIGSLILTLACSQILPADFAWGTATAAFQVEGAWNVSGRQPSIWDYFQVQPGRIANGDTAQVADDFYNRYAEDIALMKTLGVKAFRLSLSWTRILPTGGVDNINEEGITFYLNLLTAVRNAGLDPYVTLFHWDLPQTYNNFTSISTWLDPDVPNKFNAYADLCFSRFGHLVKKWLTMNEISTFTWIGYGIGTHAPGRCSPEFGSWCQSVGGGGNSSTEPYIAAHNALLAHGLAVRTYRTKYQQKHGGKIGMTINSGYALPYNVSNQDDVKAVNTNVAFGFGWFADPIVFGRYPPEMTSVITGGRLPTFNASATELMKGSYDFLGLNYYSSNYVRYTGIVGSNYGDDSRVAGSPQNASGHVIGPQAESTWLYVYPEGLRSILTWIKRRYSNPQIYIFENGCSCPNESLTPLPQVLNDTFRVDYVYYHVMNILDSIIEDGVNVKGYFLWSLLDNFEWADGYNVRFGITYVDYANNLTRIPKESYYLYQSLINYLGSTHYNKMTMPSSADLIRRAKLIEK